MKGAAFTAVSLIALVALAAGLRLAGIGERTLSWDEAYHVQLVLLPSLTDMLGAVLANPPSDPLFVLILRSWTELAGTTDAIVRIPSIIAGLATPLATFWLGRELSGRWRVALAGAFLIAIAPYAVEFGQEASLYSSAALATTLALAAGFRWRRTGSTRDGAIAVMLAVIAVYSHYVVPVVLGVAALLALSPLAGPRRVSVPAVAAAVGIVLLAWLPWLIPMLSSWVGAEQPRTALAHAASANELAGALSQYTSGSGALQAGLRPVQALGLAAAAVLVVRGWIVGGRPELGGLRVVVLTAGAVFLTPWLVSLATGKWLFVAHFMLFLLPALAVVVAAGALAGPPGEAGRITGARPLRWLLAFAAVGVVGAQILGLAANAADPPHGDDGARVLAGMLTAEARPTDAVLVTPPILTPVLRQYWGGPLGGLPDDFDLRRIYPRYEAGDWNRRSLSRFGELTTGRSRAWLVYRPELDPGGELLAWIDQRHELALRGRHPFADLYVIGFD